MLVLTYKSTGFSITQGNTEKSIVKESYPTNKSNKVLNTKLKSKTIGKLRRGKRLNKKSISNMLVFAGTNPAGARSKWPTWKKIIRQSKACLWTLQETKCSETNKLKTNDFIIFEKIRNLREGGGVAIGAKTDLNPVLIA